MGVKKYIGQILTSMGFVTGEQLSEALIKQNEILRDKISGIETESLLCVPLMSKTKLIGIIEVINKADGTHFTEEDELLLNR